jgi:DNA-binding MarR family transcriptional regulator
LASALDRLLAQALASIIKEKLGQKTCENIETRLQQRYNLSLVDSIKDFYTLDATLREFFGAGADGIESDFTNRLITFSTSSKGKQWMSIENKELAQLILESYGDREKRLILEAAYREPGVILDILDRCGIPKSSGYRIINQLVEDGLLTEEGHSEASDGKKVSKYTSLFEKTKIEIDIAKGLIVQVLLRDNILNESQIVRILLRGAGSQQP